MMHTTERAPPQRRVRLLGLLLTLLLTVGASAPAAHAVSAEFWGLMSGGYIEGPPETEATIEAEWARIQSLGIKQFRLQFSQVARVEGYDKVVERAARHDVTLLPVLYAATSSGQRFPNKNDTTGYNSWLSFVSAFVARYGSSGSFWRLSHEFTPHPMRAFEVWNEPNRPENSPLLLGEIEVECPRGRIRTREAAQAHHYAQFLIDNAATIRAADPAATIVSAGLDSTPSAEACPPIQAPVDFANKMFEDVRNDGAWGSHTPAQVKAAFDGFGLHPYAFGNSFEDRIAKFKERVEAARSVLAANGDGSPLWLTEMGWSVGGENLPANEPVSTGEQGKLLTEAMTWVRNQSTPELKNIKYAAWYYYRDTNEPGGLRCAPFRVCWQNHAGLLDAGGTTRPAWCAYSRLIGTNLCPYIPPGGFNTETFSTVSETRNGTPGTASVIGHVFVTNPGFENEPINGVFVNVNFEKLVNGTWTTMSSAHPTVTNNYYEIRNWGVGVGTWRVRTVLPTQGNYNTSLSGYHEFTIQPVSTETFITLDGFQNGAPGTASVSGNVQHNGNPVAGTVNVNFQKWNGSTWQTMSTAQRTLSNGRYSVVNWGVGVGQWRVRAVFPEQGDYAESASGYKEFSIQPVATQSFLTIDSVRNGSPGAVWLHGNVLWGGGGACCSVNVNFQKWNGSSWQTMSTATPGLSNGSYSVSNWGVGVGSWRVRAVFNQQGDFGYSESEYHSFTINR